ncbi:MAG TPA: ferric reductase-like transmembrane domain-containing protein [Solirubrobacteraceae bacterium]|nr:ferric reductase-like transmembrane domain-containing protein [Solirubrobacteraceae bacterium]
MRIALEARISPGPAPRRITGWDVAVLVAANAVAVAGLWWRQGGVREVHDLAGLLTSLGRLTGLLGAFLALVQLLLLARIPVLEAAGLERVSAWHRRNGIACLALLVAHTVLITVGYALADRVSLVRESANLLGDYPGVALATVALALLVAAVVTSVAAARRRLGHRAWHAIHVTVYAAVALAFSHQLATGHEFVDSPVATAYWWALYGATAAALLGFRVVLPVVRSVRHRLRVERVVREAPGVVSIEVGGERLDRLRVRSGQFLHWRFLARGHWHRARPFSLSAAPDGRRLRITVRERDGQTAGLAALRPGTRVMVEGPAGGLTSDARRRPRVALIAGGVGIAPIRALLEDTPGAPGEIAVIYRARTAGEVLFRAELDELARRRGADVHYVLGERGNGGLLSAEHLRALVPDIAERDVYVCGPDGMTAATRASLRRAGVAPAHIVTEGVGW